MRQCDRRLFAGPQAAGVARFRLRERGVESSHPSEVIGCRPAEQRDAMAPAGSQSQPPGSGGPAARASGRASLHGTGPYIYRL